MRLRLASSLTLFALVACGRPEEQIARIEGATMGTTYCVLVADMPPALETRTLHARVHGALRVIEQKMSTYDPESELSRFNASDSVDWFDVSADTLLVIEEALRVSRLSGGAFDVTVGPLVDVWGFGPQGEPRRPLPETIAAALDTVGFQRLETRATPPSIRKRIPTLRLDLSAIAKGFAVDEVTRLLQAEGVRDFLVEVGGELRASGRNHAGEPWRVAMDQPRPGEHPALGLLHLADCAVATSGDTLSSFVEDGRRYSHIIDPRTGRSVSTGVASATVLSASAMEADAFATTLMVLPPEEGLRLAEREGLEARILVRAGGDFVEHSTASFRERIP
jgi:thiamine biosynthesis lipoprotein